MMYIQNIRYFWRRSLFLLIMAILLSASSFGPSFAESKDICRNFAVQPKTFAELNFLNTKQYENKNYGVFIRFGIRNQILSIFKYDAGQTNITDEFLQTKLKSSGNSIEKATTKRGDDIIKRGAPFVWKIGEVLFYGVSYQVTRKKHDLTSIEYVGLSHNTACMLKVRYTDALKTKPDVSLRRYKSYAREAHEVFE